MDSMKVIMGAISIIIGLVLLPLMATFRQDASANWNGTAWVDDTNVTGLAGMGGVLDLIMYGFAFGLVGIGIGMLYIGFKTS